jgi:hypothetical protein
MKSMNLSKITIALAALAAGTSVYAQEESGKGTVANLTLKLTEYLTDPALLKKDEDGKFLPGKIPTFENEFTVESASKSVSTYEYGSKITTYKISNKEFLEGLKDEVGLITDIRGWAVVVVERDGENTTFITKKGANPINVSQYLYYVTEEAGAEQASYKSVTTENFSNDTSSEKETGSFKAKYLVGVKGNFPSTEIDLQGVYSESETLKTFGKGEDQYTQWIPGARSITNISGSLDFEEEGDEGDTSVVMGSISAAAGKQIDISLYFND